MASPLQDSPILMSSSSPSESLPPFDLSARGTSPARADGPPCARKLCRVIVLRRRVRHGARSSGPSSGPSSSSSSSSPAARSSRSIDGRPGDRSHVTGAENPVAVPCSGAPKEAEERAEGECQRAAYVAGAELRYPVEPFGASELGSRVDAPGASGVPPSTSSRVPGAVLIPSRAADGPAAAFEDPPSARHVGADESSPKPPKGKFNPSMLLLANPGCAAAPAAPPFWGGPPAVPTPVATCCRASRAVAAPAAA